MADKEKSNNRNTWTWVPSLYFAEGIPYVIVMTLSVIFYKRMGISNADIALYTSWLYLPWVIKPLWSPLVDLLKTKRYWIVIMQLFIGVGLAGIAFTIPLGKFFQYTLAFFWLLAFSSATHDIAADGFYMLGLSKHDQAFFVGIRSTFYRMAMLTGQGLLVILAGHFESKTGLPKVEIDVHAGNYEQIDFSGFSPESLFAAQKDSGMYFIADNEIKISLDKISTDQYNEFVLKTEKWNIQNNFYSEEEKISIESESNELIGNIGYCWFKLSQSPEEGESVILNFSHDSGNKSISLIRNYRYEFTSQNWEKAALAVFQIDSKLDEPVSAKFEGISGNIRFAWTVVFIIISGLFFLFFLYHRFVLPRPVEDVAAISGEKGFLHEFLNTFAEFFRKKEIVVMLIFLLVYRLGESQLVKLASPFLLDSRELNGLGLTTGEIGLIYGTLGILFLSLGGIIGGILASKNGLKHWLWWMVIAMNLPNLVYVFLSITMPESLWIIGASVAVEQFGYGFGFTAYMLYMIYISEGKHKTAHFAITTAFMALGMMIPGMISGWLQELIGYQNFFIWVMICTIPAFLIIPFVKIDSNFGKKQ